MLAIKILRVDAFTRTAGKGNRAGVVLEADGLSDEQMQLIAHQAGYSETAFILRSIAENHDLRVRYFTPTVEVPICGHATVAAHYARAVLSGITNRTLHVLTGAGILPVTISGEGPDTVVTMRQSAPTYGDLLNDEITTQILTALGTTQNKLRADLPLQIVSTGHSKIMIPLKNREAIDALTLDFATLKGLSEKVNCNGFFVFAIEQENLPLSTYGRMFAPAIGVNEDPVTGNANGPAGAYLFHHGVLPVTGRTTYFGHQGVKMGKEGTVQVSLTSHAAGVNVEISGLAVIDGTDSQRY